MTFIKIINIFPNLKLNIYCSNKKEIQMPRMHNKYEKHGQT